MIQSGRWVILAMALGFGGVACDFGHSCTDIGCESGLSLDVRLASGSWADGDYVLSAGTTNCSFSIPRDVGSSRLDCNGARGSLGPSGFQVFLTSTPKMLAIELERDGAAILEEESTPSYTDNMPNGPDCGPACRQGSVDFVVTQ
jgi:hypothetical protein